MTPLSQPETGRWLERGEVLRALNPHLAGVLKVDARHEVQRLPAARLLSPERIDIMAKYLYARHRAMGIRDGWGHEVYRDHLAVWNAFEESDGSGKRSFESYREAFDRLLDAFASQGFDERRGLVPLGSGGVIVDGAHRVAAGLATGRDLEVVRFGFAPPRYDYRYFRERGLSDAALEDMVLHYCRLDSRVRVAVLFPVARGRDGEVIDILESAGPVLYRKAVHFTAAGRANLIRLIYRGEPWAGDGVRLTPGIAQHAARRFTEGQPVEFIFFVGADAAANRDAKQRIRELFTLGNDSLHINDTHLQTLPIAESVLNANSVHLLNHRRASRPAQFERLFAAFKEWLAAAHLEAERFCIDASAVLAAYGLRDVNDLDYLYVGNDAPAAPEPLVSCHNAAAQHYDVGIDALVMDPRNYFYWRGLKFVSVARLREMKRRRGEAKDRADLRRIDALGGGGGAGAAVAAWLQGLPDSAQRARYRAQRAIKAAIPVPLLPFAEAVYGLPARLRESLGPRNRVMIYRGFELHFSRGTSLIEQIRGGRTYEPEVAAALARALARHRDPTCLDVGANIGLTTFNLIADVPGVRVFAFEPGPHQATLLERNIEANRLAGRVSVVRSALGEQAGTAAFAVHSARHASGDGLRDTGRAGPTRSIPVPVTTVDAWWHAAGAPRVHAVKLDTEGAELWILRGGAALLRRCRPVVVFELHPQNIRVYPYSAADLLQFLNTLGYAVRTLSGIAITPGNLGQYLSSAHDYVAESESA